MARCAIGRDTAPETGEFEYLVAALRNRRYPKLAGPAANKELHIFNSPR
jgi:hypothetical protein